MPDPKTRIGDGAGNPLGLYLATLAERDPLCLCSWSLYSYQRDNNSVFYLKYRNLACVAVAWHLALTDQSRQDKAA
jgi:hypothetical protein